MSQNASANPISPPRVSSSAAGWRARRLAAAQLLGGCTFRSDLEWSQLQHLPDWAALPPQALTNFEWVTGAWAHAYSLHRCIDGKILAAVRQRLGDAGMAALMKSGERDAGATQGESKPLDVSQYRPKDLDGVFAKIGREWLLASVSMPTLRRALCERLWPGTPDVSDKLPSSASAQAVIQAVMIAFGAAAPAEEKA